MRARPRPPQLGIPADVARYRGTESDLVEPVDRHKGWRQCVLALYRLGLAISLGSGEHDLNDMEFPLPTRRFEDEGDPFRRDLEPRLLGYFPASRRRRCLARSRRSTGQDPDVLVVDPMTQEHGVVAKEEHGAPEAYRLPVIHDPSVPPPPRRTTSLRGRDSDPQVRC